MVICIMEILFKFLLLLHRFIVGWAIQRSKLLVQRFFLLAIFPYHVTFWRKKSCLCKAIKHLKKGCFFLGGLECCIFLFIPLETVSTLVSGYRWISSSIYQYSSGWYSLQSLSLCSINMWACMAIEMNGENLDFSSFSRAAWVLPGI